MTLKEIFKRREIKPANKLSSKYSGWGSNFEVIEGPFGYISLSPKQLALDVVVDITSNRLKRRTENLLQDLSYNLTNDGEYNFRLPLSAVSLSCQLIGLQVNRRG